MANKRYDKEEGVWRTIGGRRIFIKTGQSLSEAMIKSGKFKGTKGVQREGYTNEEYKKQEDKIHVAKQQYDTLRNEELKEKMGRAIVSSDEYSSNDIETVINDRLDKEDEIRELQKQYKEMEKKPYTERKMTVSQNEKENLDKLTNEIEKAKEIRSNKEDFEYNLYKRAKENPDSIDPMTENSTDWEALDKKYGEKFKNDKKDKYDASLPKKYKGTIEYLQSTTNMTISEIYELLKKIEQDKK